jgi:hypothetical protein
MSHLFDPENPTHCVRCYLTAGILARHGGARPSWKTAARLAGLMALNFTLIALNFRYLAVRSYIGAIATDVLIAYFGFTLFKRTQAAEGWRDRLGYVLGASVGSAIAIWLT